MKAMYYLIALTVGLLIWSFFKNKKKTGQALKSAGKKLLGVVPLLFLVLIAVSCVFYVVPETTISRYLSGSGIAAGFFIALILGSITMIPGFIAFPLSGLLRQNGVPFTVISAFTTSLMMVGVLTFPIERKYFGFKVALLRNLVSLGIAAAVAVVTGSFFGELW